MIHFVVNKKNVSLQWQIFLTQKKELQLISFIDENEVHELLCEEPLCIRLVMWDFSSVLSVV